MITGINHITLAVRDIHESFEFYINVLGFKPIQRSPASAYLLAGDTWIALTKDDCARSDPLEEYTHIGLNVLPENFDAVKSRLQAAGVNQWQNNISEGDSFYFLDPNGHKLEIHCTDLDSRIRSGKETWGSETEWFV